MWNEKVLRSYGSSIITGIRRTRCIESLTSPSARCGRPPRDLTVGADQQTHAYPTILLPLCLLLSLSLPSIHVGENLSLVSNLKLLLRRSPFFPTTRIVQARLWCSHLLTSSPNTRTSSLFCVDFGPRRVPPTIAVNPTFAMYSSRSCTWSFISLPSLFFPFRVSFSPSLVFALHHDCWEGSLAVCRLPLPNYRRTIAEGPETKSGYSTPSSRDQSRPRRTTCCSSADDFVVPRPGGSQTCLFRSFGHS